MRVKRVVRPEGKFLREYTVSFEVVGGQAKELNRYAGSLFREATIDESDGRESFNEATFSPVVIVPTTAEEEAGHVAPAVEEDVKKTEKSETEKKSPKTKKPAKAKAPKAKAPKAKSDKPAKAKVKAPRAKAKSEKQTKAKAKAKAKVKAEKPAKTKSPKVKTGGTGESRTRKSGQSGPELDFFVPKGNGSRRVLNSKERRVLGFLVECEGPSATLDELASIFKKSVSVEKANSWVRNSLRRLVCGGLVNKIARATYSITALGKRATSAPQVPDRSKPKPAKKDNGSSKASAPAPETPVPAAPLPDKVDAEEQVDETCLSY